MSLLSFQVTKLKHFTSRHQSFLQVFSLFAVSAIVLLSALGRGSVGFDEAVYAQISKEMVAGGDWLTLHVANQPWFEKPPLFMWMTAALYRLFGVTVFWSRAASAFSGIALVLLNPSC
jgi:4-amino-4-deoxy-L-arabinose transferase-like glycosyltransferase